MSADFTPGPWQCETHINPGDAQAPWIGRLVERRYTALACGDSLDERFANGALIAASPDLLDLIEEALDLVPRMSDDDPIAPALAEWCKQARSVRMKALGAVA